MAVWITSDTHFYHTNVVSLEREMLDKAGYSYIQTVEQYNEMVVRNINRFVNPSDTLYILGDFCFGDFTKVKEMYDKLNGNVIILLGNHDNYSTYAAMKHGIKHVKEGPIYLRDSKGKIILSHCPVQEAYHNPFVYNLHGHLHGSILAPEMGNFINVSMSVNNFEPLSLDKLKKKIFSSVKRRSDKWLEEWFAGGYMFLTKNKTDVVMDETGRIKLEESRELHQKLQENKK